MRSAIIYCPHLGRDIGGLLKAVPEAMVYLGQPTEKGEDGCLQSHQAIVAMAKEGGWPEVFVMEDDCEFTEHFDSWRWTWATSWTRNNGYDVLAGGCTRTYDERVVLPYGHHVGYGMIEVSAFHSAHCVVYLASSYERVLRTTQPHDVMIGRTGNRCVLTWPFVAVQRPSVSGILRQQVNYVPYYEAHERRLGHALGLLEPHIAMEAY